MSRIVEELDEHLRTLDPATASRVERLVRDALALADADSGVAHVSSPVNRWPEGYFDQTAGALAGEQFDRLDQKTAETRKVW